MTSPIMLVENLGKLYRLKHQANGGGYHRFSESLTHWAKTPFRAFLSKKEQGKQLNSAENFWALKDISFEIESGAVVGIIGRNGAGKSTLLKILSRVTEPTTGRITLKKRLASLLEVGTGFHPELTGRENIFLNGAILGMRQEEIKARFDEIVTFAEVEKFLDTPVKHYSSGMYVRLAFSVAAHLEPEILVVDEVLAVGDAQFQKKCLGKLQSMAGTSGRTIIFVSHNMNSIERLCNRVIHLDRGKIAGDYTDVRRGIMTYLQGDSQGAALRWQNKSNECQNDVFIPQSLEVASQAPNWTPGEAFTNDHAIVITTSGLIRTDDPALNIGIGLYDEQGTLIFWSFIKDVPEENWPDSLLGEVSYKMQIPARWLNEGDYRVELLAGLHCRGWSLEPGGNAPSVNFSVQGGLSDSPLWHSKRPGQFAPVIPWHRES